MKATYSPDDNKLRLYADGRLDRPDYDRVKAAGFKWAPKQELFVAPMWTPAREDLLIEMCGEVDDEDKTLVERADERAERFEGYSEKRANDAETAHRAVKGIMNNIPFGQPIIIGHHSERKARKHAEQIENGLRKAVNMWETSQYWISRAAGAVRNASYKERPDVRSRRIKGMEADRRKQANHKAESEKWLRLWSKEGLTQEQGIAIANYCHLQMPKKQGDREDFSVSPSAYNALTNSHSSLYAPRSLEEVVAHAKQYYPRYIAHCDRWINHFTNRIEYERAMLAESGGTVADKTGPEVGGACQCWASPRDGWSYIKKVNKVSVTIMRNFGDHARNFSQTMPLDKLLQIMTAAQVQVKRDSGALIEVGVIGFILNEKPDTPKDETSKIETPTNEAIEAMKAQLKVGIKVVTAPQLYPTPRDVAERMAELADIQPGERVLEPSGGTGALIGAMGGRMFGHNPERGAIVTVEINRSLCDRLKNNYPLTDVRCADFLLCNEDLGKFDVILMNPPFAGADDIKHINHALTMLNPGGRLVAICADGPRQQDKLMSMADSWEKLPRGTFSDAGTQVNTVLLTIRP